MILSSLWQRLAVESSSSSIMVPLLTLASARHCCTTWPTCQWSPDALCASQTFALAACSIAASKFLAYSLKSSSSSPLRPSLVSMAVLVMTVTLSSTRTWVAAISSGCQCSGITAVVLVALFVSLTINHASFWLAIWQRMLHLSRSGFSLLRLFWVSRHLQRTCSSGGKCALSFSTQNYMKNDLDKCLDQVEISYEKGFIKNIFNPCLQVLFGCFKGMLKVLCIDWCGVLQNC